VHACACGDAVIMIHAAYRRRPASSNASHWLPCLLAIQHLQRLRLTIVAAKPGLAASALGRRSSCDVRRTVVCMDVEPCRPGINSCAKACGLLRGFRGRPLRPALCGPYLAGELCLLSNSDCFLHARSTMSSDQRRTPAAGALSSHSRDAQLNKATSEKQFTKLERDAAPLRDTIQAGETPCVQGDTMPHAPPTGRAFN
jgi:hypothetical protein